MTGPGEEAVRLPLAYHDVAVACSYHLASAAAVAALLPHDRGRPLLRPLPWPGGRTVVAVHAFRYRTVTWTGADGATRALAPYGEVGVTAGVLAGPAARGGGRPATGGFVLQLPVTSREARDLGRARWGLPKWLADMDFLDAPGRQRVRLTEGGTEVLTHTVAARGPAVRGSSSRTLWSVRAGRLLETTVPVLARWQARPGSGSATLALDDHPVAAELRRLELSPEPLAAFRALEYRSTLPEGRPLVPVTSPPVPVLAGSDAVLGRFTVTHPGTAPLPQYPPASVPA
ncbi:Acetoacetate decarboxylase (ADC) [Geodermatophilus dictyosporus]|uniref:Acetoacetate decarboxylase (ADC) n=1 Tax=Geodermatophilus dictyosporus TaxID=1523247 RepID=A0A1I5JBR7_9ACTN|nr:acetoacetate decarboxylase family protein [Geodermatophilus dictyosporus]SFO70217.1 Acetoacetate decarboxylase (ADC) [Geodermatophilus dictyosporus]